MTKSWKKVTFLLFLLLSLVQVPQVVHAQSLSSDETEVYLSFRHRGVINSVVITYFKNDTFYLPIGELFRLFQIDYKADGFIASGKFSIEQSPYSLDFEKGTATFNGREYTLTADDYIFDDLDFYIKPELLSSIFSLDFSVDFNSLTLNLETNQELPIVARALRQQRRRVADSNRQIPERFPLLYDRKKPLVDGGFLDYNFSSNISQTNNAYNYSSNIGLQVVGGDLQGSIFGSYSKDFSNFATNNLRWRNSFGDNPWLTTMTIGQTNTDGLLSGGYSGIRISNEPIEPRRFFDEFEVQGSTFPESEVELYLNELLIDFKQADELGNYRFLTPITYGTSQLDVRIYGPTGQVIERSTRIQVPFTFIPKGELNYTANIGKLNNPLLGSTNRNNTAQVSGSYGVNSWLTAKAGVEHFDGLVENPTTLTGSLSSRILNNYLITLEAATNAYYRGVMNVIYPNSASLNFDYTSFQSGFGLYNPSNDDKILVAGAFYPFNLFGLPFNIRANTFTRFRNNFNTTSFRLDANTRLGKTNLRIGYSDRSNSVMDLFTPSPSSGFEASATYNISRNPSLPSYLRGVFLRAGMKYQPANGQLESADFLFSRNVFTQGRIQFSYGRNFIRTSNIVRFSLVIDFNKIRTNSTFNSSGGNGSFIQNVRGSLGYDNNYNNFLLTSRDQVGRSGASVRLFVDNNSNGIFDEGDDNIDENAIRMDRTGASTISKDGITYFTQMQPYFQYNLQVNKGAIRNPMLVSTIERFSMITDPNRFKKIEVPFYMSGVLEGKVEREFENGTVDGISGLKLIVEGIDNDFVTEVRTFSDGSYYMYELPPGNYIAKVDTSQLKILNSFSRPKARILSVKATKEGDFLQEINFMIIPNSKLKPKTESSSSQKSNQDSSTDAPHIEDEWNFRKE